MTDTAAHIILDGDSKRITDTVFSRYRPQGGSTFLITGANGMLAGFIVRALIHANEHGYTRQPFDLYLLSRSGEPRYGKKPYLHYLSANAADIVYPDIRFDYVVHAASKAAPKLYMQDAVDTLNTNILGLYRIFDAVTPSTKGVVFVSSSEVYGTPDSPDPIAESYVGRIDHLNSRSCYVEGKRVCETLCMTYAVERHLPVNIGRLFHTFGPGMNLGDGRVFSDFFRDGMEKRDITIMGDPDVVRSYLYAADAAIMFLMMLFCDKKGRIYNIGSDANVASVRQFAETVADAFVRHAGIRIGVENKAHGTVQYYANAVKRVLPDITRFREDFAYAPDTDLRAACERTVRYYAV